MRTLDDVSLRIAQTIQLQSVRFKDIRLYSNLIGYVQREGVIVTAPPPHKTLGAVIEGDAFVCRAFGGKHAVAFNTKVLKVQSAPFPHIYLHYPTQVEVVEVRKNTRVPMSLAISVAKTVEGAEVKYDATLLDLSLSGAALSAPVALAAAGDAVELILPATDQAGNTELRLTGTMRNSRAHLEQV
ncbi:MAG: hypothetical protein RL684_439, partial [Pseudomonadota bacterium]